MHESIINSKKPRLMTFVHFVKEIDGDETFGALTRSYKGLIPFSEGQSVTLRARTSEDYNFRGSTLLLESVNVLLIG